MSKRWQQILSGYVALCVAFAGAVGLSPALHVWLEHGGVGARHSHAFGLPHRHGPSIPPAPARGQFTAVAPSGGLTLPESSPTLLGFKPQDLLHWLVRALGEWGDESSSAPGPTSSHPHYSLAQLLLNGAVEGMVAAPPFALPAEPAEWILPSLGSMALPVVWYAPAASRPPPVFAGPVS